MLGMEALTSHLISLTCFPISKVGIDFIVELPISWSSSGWSKELESMLPIVTIHTAWGNIPKHHSQCASCLPLPAPHPAKQPHTSGFPHRPLLSQASVSVHIARAGFSAWSALSFVLQLYRLPILQGPAPKSLLFKILLDSPNPLCRPVDSTDCRHVAHHPALWLLFNRSCSGSGVAVRKHIGSGTWVQILSLTLTSYVTLGKLLTLSVPQFPNLFSGDDKETSFRLWLRSFISNFWQCLVHSQCSINFNFY